MDLVLTFVSLQLSTHRGASAFGALTLVSYGAAYAFYAR